MSRLKVRQAHRIEDEEKALLKIGALARQAREDLGIPLRELARRLKVSSQHVSQLELGNRPWKDKTIKAWRRAMGI